MLYAWTTRNFRFQVPVLNIDFRPVRWPPQLQHTIQKKLASNNVRFQFEYKVIASVFQRI